MWIAGVWNPFLEFPDLLQVLQEKVRQNVIWGYENARLRPGIFDLRPKRNPAPSGAAFFYPRRYAAAPRGCRRKTPGPPPVGFASEVWNLSFFSRLIIRQLKKHWFRTLYEKKGFGTSRLVTICI